MAVIGVGLFGWIVPNSIVWLVVCVLFAVSEAMTAGLVTIWFALGAFVASIVSIFTDNFLVQLTIFVVVSVISLIYTKPLFNKYISKKIVRTNAESLIGDRAVVTVAIERNKRGRVDVTGQDWGATTRDGEEIKVGQEVLVVGISGVALIVEERKK